jgi:hypothetical protein
MQHTKPISNIFEPVFMYNNKNLLIPPRFSPSPQSPKVLQLETSAKDRAQADTTDCTPTDSSFTLSPQSEKIIHASDNVSTDDAPMDLPKSKFSTIQVCNPKMVEKIPDEIGLDELLDSLPRAKKNRSSRRTDGDCNNK